VIAIPSFSFLRPARRMHAPLLAAAATNAGVKRCLPAIST
jgi:hypothetical protein